jgi:hypothetical protein
MNLRIVITPDAGLDIAEAKDWYDSQTPGAGEKFYSAFRDRLAIGLKSPLSPRAWGAPKNPQNEHSQISVCNLL